MFHKEHNTLDLLGQYSQNSNQSRTTSNDPANTQYRELGQFLTKTDTKANNRTFGIPNFLWYLVMLGMLIYILRGMDFSQIHTASDAISTVKQTLSGELSQMQQETHKALRPNVNTPKEQN